MKKRKMISFPSPFKKNRHAPGLARTYAVLKMLRPLFSMAPMLKSFTATTLKISRSYSSPNFSSSHFIAACPYVKIHRGKTQGNRPAGSTEEQPQLLQSLKGKGYKNYVSSINHPYIKPGESRGTLEGSIGALRPLDPDPGMLLKSRPIASLHRHSTASRSGHQQDSTEYDKMLLDNTCSTLNSIDVVNYFYTTSRQNLHIERG